MIKQVLVELKAVGAAFLHGKQKLAALTRLISSIKEQPSTSVGQAMRGPINTCPATLQWTRPHMAGRRHRIHIHSTF